MDYFEWGPHYWYYYITTKKYDPHNVIGFQTCIILTQSSVFFLLENCTKAKNITATRSHVNPNYIGTTSLIHQLVVFIKMSVQLIFMNI